MYEITDLKPGRAISIDGEPFIVVSSVFGRKSQSKANMQCKLKNMKTGAVIAKNFQGSEKIEPADVGYRKVQYLYNDGSTYTFMDLETYDQFPLDNETADRLRAQRIRREDSKLPGNGAVRPNGGEPVADPQLAKAVEYLEQKLAKE